jgi:hypothetical protein
MRLSSISLIATLITITIGFSFIYSANNTSGMEALGPFMIGVVILLGGALVNGVIGLIVMFQYDKPDKYIGALSTVLSIASIIAFFIF